MNNLIQRIITGTLFGVLVLGSAFLGPIYQTVFFGIFMVIGLWEYYRMCSQIKILNISTGVGMFAGISTFLILLGVTFGLIPDSVYALIIPLLFCIMAVELWKNHPQPIMNIAVSLLGIFYIVIPFYLSILLGFNTNHLMPNVVGMLLLIWTNDTMAYFIGKTWGKRKLFERISPKKTWEGTIGGLFFTVIIGIIIGTYINQGLTFFWIIAALITGPTAIIGDLIESLFKRNLSIKDSGNLLPGHGGVLDRFDAALFSIPFFYCWFFLYFNW